jgi:hypothetical protein
MEFPLECPNRISGRNFHITIMSTKFILDVDFHGKEERMKWQEKKEMKNKKDFSLQGGDQSLQLGGAVI